jgi:hypothetical protein
MISRERDGNVELYQNLYVRDSSDGEDVPVYIIDTGANKEHPVSLIQLHENPHLQSIFSSKTDSQQDFAHSVNRWRWIHPQPMFDGAIDEPEDDAKLLPGNMGRNVDAGHGTAMTSLVMGKTVGVAKKALPIIVRIGSNELEEGGHSRKPGPPEAWLDGIRAIVNELFAPPDQTDRARAVALMAFYFDIRKFVGTAANAGDWTPTTEDKTAFAAWTAALHENLEELDRLGVVLITGSGNNRQVRKLPSLCILGSMTDNP